MRRKFLRKAPPPQVTISPHPPPTVQEVGVVIALPCVYIYSVVALSLPLNHRILCWQQTTKPTRLSLSGCWRAGRYSQKRSETSEGMVGMFVVLEESLMWNCVFVGPNAEQTNSITLMMVTHQILAFFERLARFFLRRGVQGNLPPQTTLPSPSWLS